MNESQTSDYFGLSLQIIEDIQMAKVQVQVNER
jgi:hypothetical protein